MQKTISLDIQNSLSLSLDISDFFQVSEVKTLWNHRFKSAVDDFSFRTKMIDISKRTSLSAGEFECIPMLDIVHPEVVASRFWQQSFPYLKRAKRIISVLPSLKTKLIWPLDIRNEQPILSDKKYPDIFKRTLPVTISFSIFLQKCLFFLKNHRKKLLQFSVGFASILLVIIVTIPLSLYFGINTLKSLADAKNMSEFQSRIHTARNHFERSNLFYFPLSWIPGEYNDMFSRGIRGAKSLSNALDILSSTIPNNEHFEPKIIKNNDATVHRAASKDIFIGENVWIEFPTDWLEKNYSRQLEAINEINVATQMFAWAQWNHIYAQKMREAWKILKNITPALNIYAQNSEIIFKMLGKNEPQRYMIFNQNRDEIRTNGGFPGSIISFTLYKWNILDFRSDDVYYYDWNLYPHKELPPPGLALLSNNYGLRDVNYYPDFRQTLEKANEFVERSGDSTVTTAIAIHQWLVEDLLKITWPVSVDGIPIAFDSNNFSMLMSVLVEAKFEKDKTPKDILFRFMSAFAHKFKDKNILAPSVEIMASHLSRGEILMASRDRQIQDFLTTIQPPLPWKTDLKNWIYPVFTSISGNKSDRYITRSIKVKTQWQWQCEYKTTVEISLFHQYNRSDASKIDEYMNVFGITDPNEREKMEFIQWNGENQAFVRLFVPKWAQLLGSKKDEITPVENEESTHFEFIMRTKPGQTTQKNITYTQKIVDCLEYDDSIPVFRQPGLRQITLDSNG